MSWVTLEDVIGAILVGAGKFAGERRGEIVAPAAADSEFGSSPKELVRAMHRPAMFTASRGLLCGWRWGKSIGGIDATGERTWVTPARLKQMSFAFQHENLAEALAIFYKRCGFTRQNFALRERKAVLGLSFRVLLAQALLPQALCVEKNPHPPYTRKVRTRNETLRYL